MSKYLVVKNRGACPREMIEFRGATAKRSKMSDGTQGGWFGTDTNYCPIAALNLDISVGMSSVDETGKYFLFYRSVERKIAGEIKRQMTIVYDKGTTIPTQDLLDSCLGMDTPIGMDTMKSYRVLRGYLRNAFDADPEGFSLEEVEKLTYAEEGTTRVYLTNNAEFDHMRKHPDRYFKWLAKTPAMAVIPGVGAIYPKSDPENTRVFSQGSLGDCTADEPSLYDYSLDRKELRAENSELKMGDATMEINKMLCRWQDVDALEGLLRGMEGGTAKFELGLIGYLGHLNAEPEITAANAWKAAFHRVHGDDAVLSASQAADSMARHGFRRKPVALADSELKRFLLRCGVPSAQDLVPDVSDKPEYRVVEIDEAEKAKLGMVLAALHQEYPETAPYEIVVFEPVTEKMRTWRGFATWSDDDGPVKVHVQRGIFLSNTMLVRTLGHEFRHGRSRCNDENRKFVEYADNDIAGHLMKKYGIPDEPIVDITALPLPPPPLPTDAMIDAFFEDIDLEEK